MSSTFFAYLFAAATLISVLFQLALAVGMPWGDLAMGGRFPGKFPPNLRIGAVVQAVLLAFLACIVLAKAGAAFLGLSNLANSLVWVAVGISGLSLVLNLITPSKWERRLWAPVALVMTIASLLVALS